MDRHRVTRVHVSGYLFLWRRMEHALVRRDIAMRSDPMRAQAQSIAVGAVVAVLLCAGCVVLALLRPRPDIRDKAIVMDRDTGVVYVRISGALHPTLNLTSAQLIAGTHERPTVASAEQLSQVKRGALVGIPGAPPEVAAPLTPDESEWTVCDRPANHEKISAATTVIVGPIADGGVTHIARDERALVSASPQSSDAYLVYDGRRARVDLFDPAVVRALRLEGQVPRTVSAALLNAIPEVPEVKSPIIAGRGEAGPIRGVPVGSVVRVLRSDSAEFYAVLVDGVQRVSQVVADLIRFTDSVGNQDITTVSPDTIGRIRTVERLPVDTFPGRSVALGAGHVLMCASWVAQADGGRAAVAVMTADALPLTPRQVPVLLAQADGTGPSLDAVYLPPGRSIVVRSTGLGGGIGSDPVFLVSDIGVRFGIPEKAAADALGLPEPTAAPWPIVGLLSAGPALSKREALVAH